MRNKLISTIHGTALQNELTNSDVLDILFEFCPKQVLEQLQERLELNPRIQKLLNMPYVEKVEIHNAAERIFKVHYYQKHDTQLVQLLTKEEAAASMINKYENTTDAVDALMDVIRTDKVLGFEKQDEYYMRKIGEVDGKLEN